jgi:CRISP-associated protein Cas1
MNSLYLRPGTMIALAEDPRWLMLLHPEEGYSTAMYELGQVRSLIAFGHIGFEPEVIPKLLQSGISVIFFEGDGAFLGRLEPDFGEAPNLLTAQMNLSSEKRLQLTQRIVWGALRQHRHLLQRRQRESAGDYSKAISALDFSIKAIRKKDSVESVASLLGSGLYQYYFALALSIHHPGWGYEGRKNPLPFNAMLNFCYALIQQNIFVAIAASGLDARFGLWHSGREALARDLCTEFKPIADAIVLRCINRGQVALKDFDGWKPSLKSLPFSIREVLLESFQRKMSESFSYREFEKISYQDAIAAQAEQLRQFIAGDIGDYWPLQRK